MTAILLALLRGVLLFELSLPFGKVLKHLKLASLFILTGDRDRVLCKNNELLITPVTPPSMFD